MNCMWRSSTAGTIKSLSNIVEKKSFRLFPFQEAAVKGVLGHREPLL